MPAMSSAPGDTAERGQSGRRRDDTFDAGSPDRVVVFGKYSLMGKIGRGGMAEVYRARAASGVPPDLLAIKCMRPSLARENRFVEMFIREGKLAIMLSHPGIVRTFDVGSVDGRYFICMEYLGGKDLNHVLRRCQETGRRVPIPHALYIAQVACEALHYAHTLCNQQGRPLSIVNRDVSPSNVRVSYDGLVKLIDFGIAQAVHQITSEIGVLKGKFSYMSPEQIRGLPLDRRTDIFSSGIVLHEMLTCERLFRDESEFVLMEMVRRAQVKPPSAFNPRVPPEVDAVVMRALAREPEARYPDAQSMAAELQQLLQGYQFSPTELGELGRGLFPADYRKEQAVVQACMTGGKAPADEPEEPAASPSPSSERRHRRHREGVSRKGKSKGKKGGVRASVLWTAAIVLLLAGIAILVLALR
jgi:eukaryotic-like serine/threonine-protein kinase